MQFAGATIVLIKKLYPYLGFQKILSGKKKLENVTPILKYPTSVIYLYNNCESV